MADQTNQSSENVPAPGTEVQQEAQHEAPATGGPNTLVEGTALLLPQDPTPAPDAHDHWVKDQITFFLANNPGYLSILHKAVSDNDEAIIDGVLSRAVQSFSAGGDYRLFAQAVNTSYDGTKVALYEARMISGPMTHPLTGQELPRQTTVYDDILAAIHGLAKGQAR